MSREKFLIWLIPLILFINGCAGIVRQSQLPVAPGVYHVVGSGQTFYSIAKTYNVSIEEIMRANNIKDPTQLGVGQELFIPEAKSPLIVEQLRAFKISDIEKLVGPRHVSSRWRFITVHHSATSEGNAEIFDRNHRRRGMGGLAYHFVIGNGTGSGDGELEVGWRWRRQVKVNRPFDLQICLVGNFNKQQVSEAQYRTLIELIKVVRRQYNISLRNIRRHKDIRGKITDCPGRNFPFDRLKNELARK